MSSRVVAVVPSAGRGARMGGVTPKQYLTLGGIPLLVHSLRTLDAVEAVSEVILAVPEADKIYCEQEIIHRYGIKKVTQVVVGGQRRQDSVRNGLKALIHLPDFVVVHDGVRPFITQKVIRRVIESAILTGAAIVAIPMGDTVKRVNSMGRIEATLNREELWLAQTPQVFRFDWLLRAHQVAESQELEATDDAALVEKLGYPVSVVRGNFINMKITRPEDLVVGEAFLAARREEE